MKNWKNVLCLLLTAFIWGTAFVAQSSGMDYVDPFTFMAVRNVLGAIVLIPVIKIFCKKKETPKERKSLFLAGACCGTILFVASSLQQFGVCQTTVGKAGFITALYIIFVPIVSIFMKKRAGINVWIGVVLATIGLYLLCMTDSFSLSLGDGLVLLCALAFTGHILVIAHFSEVDGVKMSCIQFLVCAIWSVIAMLLFEEPSISAIMQAKIPILYAGIMSSGIGYTLQIIGQKNMNPTIASLLMSFESVFALLSGMVILGQVPTLREAIGGVLMFAAIMLAQIPSRKIA